MAKIIIDTPPASHVWGLPAGSLQLAGLLTKAGHRVIQLHSYISALEHILLQEEPRVAQQVLGVVRNSKATIFDWQRARLTLENVSRRIQNRAKGDVFEVTGNNVHYAPYFDPEQDDIVAAMERVKDYRSNIWYPYYRDEWQEEIKAINPDIYGVSIADERQLLPGLIQGYLAKQILPKTLVLFGGNFWIRVLDLDRVETSNLQKFAPLFECFDAIVGEEGYLPFLKIAETLDPRPASGTVWLDPVQGTQFNKKGPALDFWDLPTPVIDTIAPRQWCPDVVVPTLDISNCQHQCGFCAISAGSNTYRQNPRVTPPEEAAWRMLGLHEQVGAYRFDKVDETLPFPYQREIGRACRELNLSAEWQCYTTVGPPLMRLSTCKQLYEAGCRGAQLGLESLTSATLRQENKGWNNPENYGLMLENLYRAGIQTHVFIIVGIPGEPVSESLRWLPFLQDYGDYIVSVKSGRWRLTRHSPEESEDRHSRLVQPTPIHDLRLNRDFSYISPAGRSLRKDVEAARDLLHLAEEKMRLFPISQNLGWWANRGRFTLTELEEMADQLRLQGTPLGRFHSIVQAERGERPDFTTLEEATDYARRL